MNDCPPFQPPNLGTSCSLGATHSCPACAFGVWPGPWDSAPTLGLVEDKGLWDPEAVRA
ncbi:unnamed protein product [Gulo gulo]|uniref:Uncharacterized protein n=1 Tax=Gulo gulo TaxID=48420 RepID=A0A9X9Q7X3_GULGU|nr:unnamed protein product [Gulo gulo]